MRGRHDFMIHEIYARRMANRRFVAGVVVGAVCMFFTPMFKTMKNACKKIDEVVFQVAEEEENDTDDTYSPDDFV